MRDVWHAPENISLSLIATGGRCAVTVNSPAFFPTPADYARPANRGRGESGESGSGVEYARSPSPHCRRCPKPVLATSRKADAHGPRTLVHEVPTKVGQHRAAGCQGHPNFARFGNSDFPTWLPLAAGRSARALMFQLRPFWIYGSTRHRHARQISPGKNAMFPCTSAAFTLSAVPVGFVMGCQLARRPGLLCSFCPSPRTFALRLPPDKPSRPCPCLRLVVIINPYAESIPVLPQGTSTPLHRAHAGRTPSAPVGRYAGKPASRP